MKVLMLRNPAAVVGCQLREGETGEMPDNMGRVLVASGLALCLDPPKATPPKKEFIQAIPEPPIEAVPPSPAIVTPSRPPVANDAAKSGKTTPKKQGVK